MTNEPVFTAHEYIIGGKLVVGKVTYTDTFSQLLTSDQDARDRIKHDLCQQMATFMLENNLVEFMQQPNMRDMSTTVLVRAYLAPNDQVKILRLANKVV